jgi:hypothetical protein
MVNPETITHSQSGARNHAGGVGGSQCLAVLGSWVVLVTHAALEETEVPRPQERAFGSLRKLKRQVRANRKQQASAWPSGIVER